MGSGSLLFGLPCAQLAQQPRSCQGGKRSLGKQADFFRKGMGLTIYGDMFHAQRTVMFQEENILPRQFLAMVEVGS